MTDWEDYYDWVEANHICEYNTVDDFFSAMGIPGNSHLRQVTEDYFAKHCRFRKYFKSKRSIARMIGIDKYGRRFAVGRSGYRISPKPYARFFPK